MNSRVSSRLRIASLCWINRLRGLWLWEDLRNCEIKAITRWCSSFSHVSLRTSPAKIGTHFFCYDGKYKLLQDRSIRNLRDRHRPCWRCGSGRRQVFQKTNIIETYIDESVQGLDVGSPVKFRGVL